MKNFKHVLYFIIYIFNSPNMVQTNRQTSSKEKKLKIKIRNIKYLETLKGLNWRKENIVDGHRITEYRKREVLF